MKDLKKLIFHKINTLLVGNYPSLVFNNNELAGCMPKCSCKHIPKYAWLTKREFINKIKGI